MKLITLQEAKEDYIVQHQGEQLTNAYNDDTGQKPKLNSPVEIVNVLKQASRQYLQWIVNRYINNEFKLEDVSQIRDELVKFQAVRTKLPQNQRDLNRMTLRDLYAVLAPYEEKDVISNKEADRRYKQKLFDSGDAELFYKDSQITVVIPKTKEASCFFGKNTKWCTAAKNDNAFGYYDSGPLYIIMTHNGKKYQFWFGISDDVSEYQFMDDLDQSVELSSLVRQYPSLKKAFGKIGVEKMVIPLIPRLTDSIVKGILRRNSLLILQIPEDKLTEDICLEIVTKYDSAVFPLLPKMFHTESFLKKCVMKDPFIVTEDGIYESMPHILTNEICNMAIKLDVRVYSLLPLEYRKNVKLSVAAVKQDPKLLRYVSSQIKSEVERLIQQS